MCYSLGPGQVARGDSWADTMCFHVWNIYQRHTTSMLRVENDRWVKKILLILWSSSSSISVAAGVSSSPFPLALPACNLLPTLPSTLTYPALPLTLLPLMSTISMSMSTSSIYGRNHSSSPSTFPENSPSPCTRLMQYSSRLAGQTPA